MKNKPVIFVVFAATLALLGCATSYYQPYYGRGIGYSEVNIAKNQFVILFHGSDDQDEMDATQYAIIRAADIGKQNNFAYFRITNSQENENARQIIVHERDSNYGRRDGYHRGYWGSEDRAEIVTTRVRPVVRLQVLYQNQDCSDCLSVSEKLQEAINEKIIAP